jgi:hypothetical protein
MAAEPTPAEVDEADEQFRDWMRTNLRHAADHFRTTLGRPEVFGWRLRSIGAPATTTAGEHVWLRVVTEFPQYAHGEAWTGNVDAAAITAIPKPHVLDVFEWDDAEWRCQRAELMTLLPGHPISATDDLPKAPLLDRDWWRQLRDALDTLRAVPTTRIYLDQEQITARARATLGVDLYVQAWETVHADLHWHNLHAGPFGIADWEMWGRGPAGTDPATLLLFSLTQPNVAETVHATFADILDTADGRIAQLAVAARLLGRIHRGDFPHLVEPLHIHLDRIGVHVPI